MFFICIKLFSSRRKHFVAQISLRRTPQRIRRIFWTIKHKKHVIYPIWLKAHAEIYNCKNFIEGFKFQRFFLIVLTKKGFSDTV